MSKMTRLMTIAEIVAATPIPNLELLREELKKRGYSVSQATASRDISALKLIKSQEGYLLPPSAHEYTKRFITDPTPVLRRSVLKIDIARHMLVIRTSPGCAQQVGYLLDDGFSDDILGTVAGHNTLVVLSSNSQKAQKIRDTILRLVGSAPRANGESAKNT